MQQKAKTGVILVENLVFLVILETQPQAHKVRRLKHKLNQEQVY